MPIGGWRWWLCPVWVLVGVDGGWVLARGWLCLDWHGWVDGIRLLVFLLWLLGFVGWLLDYINNSGQNFKCKPNI